MGKESDGCLIPASTTYLREYWTSFRLLWHGRLGRYFGRLVSGLEGNFAEQR